MAFDATSLLEDYDFCLELESLHLPMQSSTGCEWGEATQDWLVAVARGERRNVSIDKIVIYGSEREALIHLHWVTIDDQTLFEWEEDWKRLVVEDFDGR